MERDLQTLQDFSVTAVTSSGFGVADPAPLRPFGPVGQHTHTSVRKGHFYTAFYIGSLLYEHRQNPHNGLYRCTHSSVQISRLKFAGLAKDRPTKAGHKQQNLLLTSIKRGQWGTDTTIETRCQPGMASHLQAASRAN